MIKDVLKELEPLDAKIAALRGDPADEDLTAVTAHAAELAELSAQEDAILAGAGALTAEDRVFLARHPERPHIDEIVDALFTDFFEQRVTASAKKMPPFWAVWRCSTANRSRSSATARAARWKKTCAATSVCPGRRATARPCA